MHACIWMVAPRDKGDGDDILEGPAQEPAADLRAKRRHGRPDIKALDPDKDDKILRLRAK